MTSVLPRHRISAAVFAAFVAVAVARADGLFIVNQPWVRPAQAGQTTEAYMDLTSSAGAKLVGVTSAAAAAAVVRTPEKLSGAAQSVTLPAGMLVALAPGKYRIVLQRLARALKPGDRVALSLTIEAADGSRQDIPVNAEVRLHSPIDDELHAHKHAHD